jgi:hypothetical protein
MAISLMISACVDNRKGEAKAKIQTNGSHSFQRRLACKDC